MNMNNIFFPKGADTECKYCKNTEPSAFVFLWQVFSNGKKHWRQECLVCKRFLKYVSQGEKDPYEAKLYFGKFANCKIMDIEMNEENKKELKRIYDNTNLKEHQKTAIEIKLGL